MSADAETQGREITEALVALREGAPGAMDRLIPLVYEQLRRIAHRQLGREPTGHTLSTTGLVHEAYLKLVDQTHAQWKDRAQFFAIAAGAMRRILVDYARRHRAIVAMQRAAELSGPRDSAQLAYIYGATGRPTEARDILRRLLDSAPQRYLPPFHIAMAYAGLGDADEAFRWLEAAYEERASFMDGLAVTMGFEAIRSDPRFDRLLRRMGLEVTATT